MEEKIFETKKFVPKKTKTITIFTIIAIITFIVLFLILYLPDFSSRYDKFDSHICEDTCDYAYIHCPFDYGNSAFEYAYSMTTDNLPLVLFIPIGIFVFGLLVKLVTRNSQKKWILTAEKIIIDKKEIPLSTICGMSHTPPVEKIRGAQGNIFINLNGKHSEKYGVDDSIALIYDKKDIENAKIAVEHLLKLFDNENYDICVDEKTGKTYTTKKQEYVKPKQFYKKCNTCGHIYCYTQADLNKNKQLSRQAAANSFASAFGPAIMSATYNQTANDNKSRIIDYDKCPKCNSADVVSITEEEVENLSKNQDTQQTNLSQADELKKFKELLDSGIITQEEFDAKKKQLLDL